MPPLLCYVARHHMQLGKERLAITWCISNIFPTCFWRKSACWTFEIPTYQIFHTLTCFTFFALHPFIASLETYSVDMVTCFSVATVTTCLWTPCPERLCTTNWMNSVNNSMELSISIRIFFVLSKQYDASFVTLCECENCDFCRNYLYSCTLCKSE